MNSGQTDMAAETMEQMELDGGRWSCHTGLYHNGSRVILDTCAGDQLILVLSGELDLVMEGMPVRLSAGGWINLPANTGAACQVYRSVDPVRLLVFQAFGGSSGASMAGNLYDMPRYRNGRESLFAFDSEGFLGRAYFGAEGDACLPAEEGLMMCLNGHCRAGGQELLPYAWKLIQKNEKICFQESDSCVIMIVPESCREAAEEYKGWMFRQHGIQWDAGIHAMRALRNRNI